MGRFRKGKKAWTIVDGFRMASARQWKFAIRYGKHLDRIAADRRSAKIIALSAVTMASAMAQFVILRSMPIRDPSDVLARAIAITNLITDTARAIAMIPVEVEREELLNDLLF